MGDDAARLRGPRLGWLARVAQGRLGRSVGASPRSAVLSVSPTLAAARGWALDVIEKNSDVAFSQEDREALCTCPQQPPLSI
jgi:hypothetical protein